MKEKGMSRNRKIMTFQWIMVAAMFTTMLLGLWMAAFLCVAEIALFLYANTIRPWILGKEDDDGDEMDSDKRKAA